MNIPFERFIMHSNGGEGWHQKNGEWYATIWAYKILFRKDLENNDDVNYKEALELSSIDVPIIPDVPFKYSSKYEKGNAYRYENLVMFYKSK